MPSTGCGYNCHERIKGKKNKTKQNKTHFVPLHVLHRSDAATGVYRDFVNNPPYVQILIGESYQTRTSRRIHHTVKVDEKGVSDQQKVPFLLPHHVSPGDVLVASDGCFTVDQQPDILEKLANTTEGAKAGCLAQARTAFFKHAAEG